VEPVISYGCVAGGLSIASVGVVAIGPRLRQLRRVHGRRIGLLNAMPEGWGPWFLRGFSDLVAGAGLVTAVLGVAAYALIGLGLMAVGLRVALRAG